MSDISEIIRQRALARIADIFNVPVDSLRQELVFGEDLKANRKSVFFSRNEHDQIESDVYDVTDKKTYTEVSSGVLTIRTVGDYCNHMIRCYEIKPADVRHVLKIGELGLD